MTGADKAVLGRAAPGALQAVGRAVERALVRELDRGLER